MLSLLSYIIPNLLTMVVQTQNEAIVEDATWQNMPIFKKSLIVLSPLARRGTSTSHNNGKIVYHKQQAQNDICKESDKLV